MPRTKQKRILAGLSIIALTVLVICLLWNGITIIPRPNDYRIIISAPAENKYTSINTNGTTVIPNGRLLRPFGKSIIVAPHPYGLAVSDDGSVAVTANSGISPLSISIIKKITGENPIVLQVPPGPSTDRGILASVYMGLAISPDNKLVYVAGGQENKIFIFGIDTGKKIDSIDCSLVLNEKVCSDGYIGDMVMTRDGNTLFALDQTGFRMVIVDTRKRMIISAVPVGRYPFGIALSPEEDVVYVANAGVFRYSKIDSIEQKNDLNKALGFPPFAYGSEEMKKGLTTGKMKIPGLGDPNVPESFSVWSVSVKNRMKPVVVSKIKTGILVGEKVDGIPAVGGSSPNSIVAGSNYVFVSNGNNDCISVIDPVKGKVIKEISLVLHPALQHFRGVIPFGLAITKDGKRLFVAESGINAIGVIDIPSLSLVGHIPVGWFPSRIKVTGDDKKLIVTNAKGFGSGPNGGKGYHPGPEGTYIGALMKGTVSVIDIPQDDQFAELSEQVIENNFRMESADKIPPARLDNPVPLYAGQKVSPVRYIVFISKENRTFDEVFGQIAGCNGDPSLARYGRNVSFTNKAKTLSVKNATVMPNHLELASFGSLADNFYVDSDVSADGHRWLVNTYPNEWVEVNSPASYGGNRDYKPSLKAPGSLGMTGAAGAIYPEDYNEAGSMWDHLSRHGIDFYNFGFGVMFEPAIYDKSFKYTGIRHFVNFPVPAPMFGKTSRSYPTFNMAIPDQFRVSQFIKEFNEKWTGKGKDMPAMLTVIMPNDHGAGERPDAGFPFRESYMADNDLAVGRIIEFLSHTPYWKNMAIIITEDDAQNGVDHADAHRSILMVISPYAKKNHISKLHYSFGSIFKTFWNILGLPYLNQYDAGATDLADMFTDKPDFTPFNAKPADPRIFDPQKALTPFDEKFDWKAFRNSPGLDNPKEMTEDQKEKPEYRSEDQKK